MIHPIEQVFDYMYCFEKLVSVDVCSLSFEYA